jgi:hypothetical protein
MCPNSVSFPQLNMKNTFAPTLKHAQTNGRMSIWTRVCRRFGIVGVKF